MPYTFTNLVAYFTAAADGVAPSLAEQTLLQAYANQDASGQLTDAATLRLATQAPWVQETTDVAVATYQFFTGTMPSTIPIAPSTISGLNFLVNSGGVNSTDLNSAYYGTQTTTNPPFNTENRYYNFALNLVGPGGAGAASFAATYGATFDSHGVQLTGLTLNQVIAQAYDSIVGDATVGQAQANAAIASIETADSYFAAVAAQRGNAAFVSTAAGLDLATKAVAIGYILEEAVKADVGNYAHALDAFTADLATGTNPNIGAGASLLALYGPGGSKTTHGVGQAPPSVTDNVGGAINEGSQVTFTFTDQNLLPGTQETYTLTGSGASQVTGPTTGTVTVGLGGVASVTVTTVGNVIDQAGSRPLTFSVNGISTATDTVTINENASITVANAATVNEGSNLVFALTASSNVPVGTQVAYTLSGPGTGNINPSLLNGTATVSPGGVVNITVPTLANDFNDAANPTKGVTLTLNGLTTPAATGTITENSTITVANPAAVAEGGQMVFTVTGVNVPAGTAETFSLSGAGTSQVTSPLTGTVTIGSNGVGTVTVNTAASVIDAAPGSTAPVILTLNGLPGVAPTATGLINETATITAAAPGAAVNEGGAVNFTVAASSNVAAGTQVSYTLSGSATGNVNGALTGVATVSPGGNITISVPTLANDFNDTANPTKTLTLTLNGLTTPAVSATINENSAFTLGDSNGHSVNEGSQATFTVTTVNVPVGTVESYTLTGAGTSQVVGSLTGTVTIGANGQATVNVSTLGNNFEGGSNPITFSLNGIAAPADTVQLQENATVSVVDNVSHAMNQGQSATFTVSASTANSAAGSTLNYSVSDTTAGQLASPANGTITFDSNGQATVTVNTLQNAIVNSNTGLAPAATTGTLTLTVINQHLVPIATDAVTVTNGTEWVTDSGNANEGGTITYTIHTTNVAAGTVETWSVAGAPAGQIVGPSSGSVVIGANGQATVTVQTAANVIDAPAGTQAALTFTANDAGGSSSDTAAKINENATITVGGANAVADGGTLTFTLSASSNVAAGTQVTYTLSGPGTANIAAANLTGTATVSPGGVVNISVPTLANEFNDPAGTQKAVTLTLNGLTTPTASGTINETSTFTVSDLNGGVFNENSIVAPSTTGNITFTVNTNNVPVGTQVGYSLSGSAAGQVVGATAGTVTVTGSQVNITVPVNALDFTNVDKQLTLTLTGIPAGPAGNNSDTVTIHENAVPTFILTPGTDAGVAFTGNPIGGNTYLATQATLGQNDVLTGLGPNNNLVITTVGPFPAFLTSFTASGIQNQNVNASTFTTIDESSVTGLTTFVDNNSSASITLNALTAGTATGILNLIEFSNATDLGAPVNLTVNYAAGVILGSADVQNVLLDPMLSQRTGLPNSTLTVNGIETFSITSQGVTPNGLTQLLSSTLNQVIFQHATPEASFVLGNGGGAGAALTFTGISSSAGANTLDLSAYQGTFYDLGNPGGDIVSNGGLTIIGGTGGTGDSQLPAGTNTGAAMNSQYLTFNALTSTFGTTIGGVIAAAGSITIDIGSGSFLGQQVTSGGSVIIQGFPFAAQPTAGGFVSNNNAHGFGGTVQTTNITTTTGSVTVTGFTGGLGGGNSISSDSFSSGPSGFTTGSRITTTSGSITIGGVGTAAVTGGVNEDLVTTSGAVTATLASGTNTVLVRRGTVGSNVTTINITGGTNFLGFGQGPVGFENFPVIGGVLYDTINASGGTNEVELNAHHLGGLAIGVQTFDFFNGGIAGVTVNANFLNQGATPLASQTFNVGTLGGTFGFQHLVSGDVINLKNGSSTTATVSLGVGGGGAPGPFPPAGFGQVSPSVAGATETLNVQGGDTITLIANLDQAVGNFINTVNFGAGASGTTTLTLSGDSALSTLAMTGTNVTAGNTSAGNGALSTVTGVGASNYNLLGLVGSAVVGVYGGIAGSLSTTAGSNQYAPGGGTINLAGAGAGGGTGIDQVAVGAGSWTITTGNGSSTVVINPNAASADVVTTGNGADAVYVGAVSGGGGTVNISTGAGNDTIFFDDTGVQPNWASDTENGGSGFNQITIIGNGTPLGGPMVITDAGFAHMSNIQEINLAPGATNNLALGANAAVEANGAGSLLIVTGGAGNLASTTTIVGSSAYVAPMNVNIGAGGDPGGDSITTATAPLPLGGADPLTVHSTVSDFNTSIEGAALTIAGSAEGIFATTTGVTNTLDLAADNNIALIYSNGGASGINGVKVINGFNGSTANMGVWLVDNAAVVSGETVDLLTQSGGVTGLSAIYGQNITSTGITEIGGGSSAGAVIFGTDVLIGANAAGNSLTAHGGVADWIYSPGGHAAVETGNDGGWHGITSPTTFIFNNVFTESPGSVFGGGAHPSVDVHITNFHVATDFIAVNPAFLPGGNPIVFVGQGVDYLSAEALLTTPSPGHAEAVYEQDNNTLWISVDGDLDASSAQIWVDPGSVLTGFSSANFVYVTGTAAVAYSGSNVVYGNTGVLTGQLTIPIWNSPGFNVLTSPGAPYSGVFVGGGGTLTTDTNLKTYNFQALSSGVTVTTQAFTSGVPFFTGVSLITGTTFADSFFVSSIDLASGPSNGLEVIGGGGSDQITIDPVGPMTINLGAQNTATAGFVLDVQTLNLIDTGGNTVTFTAYSSGGHTQAFKNINGSVGNDVITTTNFNAGGAINLAPATGIGQLTGMGSGGADTVTLTSNLAGTTITFDPTGANLINITAGSAVTTTMDGGVGLSNTTMELSGGDDISGATVSNMNTLLINNSSLIFLTPAQWNEFAQVKSGSQTLATGLVTAGNGHAIIQFVGAGNIVTTATNLNGIGGTNSYILGGTAGQSNTITLAPEALFLPAFRVFSSIVQGGAANDTVVINTAGGGAFFLGGLAFNASIDLMGGTNHIQAGNGTFFSHTGIGAFNAAIADTGGTTDLTLVGPGAVGVEMNLAHYALFEASPGQITSSAAGAASDTVTFSNATGTVLVFPGTLLDAHVGNWNLASGLNNFELGSASQNVTAVNDGASATLIDVQNFHITGTLALGNNGAQSSFIVADNGADLTGGGTTSLITTGGAGSVQLFFSNNAGPTSTVTINAAEELKFDGNTLLTGYFGSGGGASDTVQISDNTSSITLRASEDPIGTFKLLHNSTTVNLHVGFTGAGAGLTGYHETLALGTTNTDIINLDNGTGPGTLATPDMAHFATISGFLGGTGGTTDRMLITDGGSSPAGETFFTSAGTALTTQVNDISAHNASLTVAANDAGITNASMNTFIQTTAGVSLGAVTGDFAFAITDVNGNTGIYDIHTNAGTVDGVQLMGILTGINSDALFAHNFQ
jgi:hypothetical protein